ncbi:MAG TPA: VOC family protein [Actinomycetota bacterium]|nr:VOC family protein [Actinomycetota bacterium]
MSARREGHEHQEGRAQHRLRQAGCLPRLLHRPARLPGRHGPGLDPDFVSPTNPTAQLSVVRGDATAPVVAQLTVEVADVDAVHAEAVRRGVELVYPLTEEPWGVRRFFVKDPNGVVLNVASHRGDAATP